VGQALFANKIMIDEKPQRRVDGKYSVNPSLPSEKNSMFQKNLV
jgi:hypothetical protein